MAVASTFLADFSQFESAVNSAVQTLKTFEAGSVQVEQSLDAMGSGLSTQTAAADATAIAEAVTKISEPAKQSATDLQGVGAAADEAASKIAAMGAQAPEVAKVTEAGKGVDNAMKNASKSLGQVDGLLKTVGINVGPVRGAMDDLATATGKTTGQLGKLQTAGLVVTAAMAGWQIGRQVAEWLDLDKAIGGATAKLLGWGDVAAQERGAGQDVLDRASEHAQRKITDFNEAMKINQEWALKAVAANTKVAEAHGTAAKAATNYAAEAIAAHKKAFEAAEAEAAKRAAAAAAAAAKARQDRDKDWLDQNERDWDAAQDAVKRREAEQAAAERAAAAHAKLGADAAAAQAAATAKIEETNAALKRQEEAAKAANRAMGNSMTYDLSTVEGMQKFRNLNPSAAVNTDMEYFKTHTLEDAINAGLVDLYAGFKSGGGPRGITTRTGLSQTLTMPAVPPVYSNPPVEVKVSGVLDPRTVNELGKAVGDAILSSSGLRQGAW